MILLQGIGRMLHPLKLYLRNIKTMTTKHQECGLSESVLWNSNRNIYIIQVLVNLAAFVFSNW